MESAIRSTFEPIIALWYPRDLVPGVYLYWALQLYAIIAVSIALLLRRPPHWRVTAKRPALAPARTGTHL